MNETTYPSDLTGIRFGRLTVVKRSDLRSSNGSWIWICECDCGKTTPVERSNLIRNTTNATRSCGCLGRENQKASVTKHGLLYHPLYKTWCDMKERCHLKSAINYYLYGGRGISVCDRWHHSFPNFLADMGEKPGPEYTLDRKDNDGNYEPDNCRWATRSTQQRNRRNTLFIEPGVSALDFSEREALNHQT